MTNPNPNLAMYYYDCILTLPLEISEIWTGKFTVTKGLYVANRYIPLLTITCQLVYNSYQVANDKVSSFTIKAFSLNNCTFRSERVV